LHHTLDAAAAQKATAAQLLLPLPLQMLPPPTMRQSRWMLDGL
jgi:hypothetical protein